MLLAFVRHGGKARAEADSNSATAPISGSQATSRNFFKDYKTITKSSARRKRNETTNNSNGKRDGLHGWFAKGNYCAHTHNAETALKLSNLFPPSAYNLGGPPPDAPSFSSAYSQKAFGAHSCNAQRAGLRLLWHSGRVPEGARVEQGVRFAHPLPADGVRKPKPQRIFASLQPYLIPSTRKTMGFALQS